MKAKAMKAKKVSTAKVMTNDHGRSHGWVGQIWKRRKMTMKSWSKGPRRSCNTIEASVQRSGNKGEALCHSSRHIHPKKLRMGRSRGGKEFSKRAKARYAKLDDKRELSKEKVLELRYSQLSCKETFQCGRSVSQLVLDLLDRKVSLSLPFLRLTFLRLQMKRPTNLSWGV